MKVAINGLGRIGRAALKIILGTPQLKVVAVNDIVPAENIVYLLKYNTVDGRYEKTVATDGENLTIAGKTFRYSQEKDPRASIIDLGMTRVVDGDLVKILSWYDNEWGFTNQMVRAVMQIAQVTETTNVRQ